MRILRSAVALTLLAIGATPSLAQVAPQTLAKLEARRQAKPADVGTLRALGIAYFEAKRYADAENVLTAARTIAPKDAVVALYLGMSAEERGDLVAARTAYTTYLSTGRTKSAQNAVSQRLAAVAQKELQQGAKAAVAQEQRLASQPGSLDMVAVLPLSVVGNPMYEPLGRGLADLMITDFAKVPGLKLLERDRIQALLDEIALGKSNSIDRATAARSGRMLQAGRMIRGSLTVASAQNVSLVTNVVPVATTQDLLGGTASGSLDQIFDFEKAVVIQTVAKMNITLTAAQRAAIDGYRPTRNVQAFLAYSRGLVASDAGRLDEAVNFFDNARALDPNFAGALQHANQARAGQAGQAVTTSVIESKLRGSAEGAVVSAAERGVTAPATDALGTTLQNTLADVNPSAADGIGRSTTTVSSRDPASSTTASDQASPRMGTLTILIKRP